MMEAGNSLATLLRLHSGRAKYVCDALEIDHATVAKIETGERRLDVIEYFQVVVALGSDPKLESGKLMELLNAVGGETS